MSLIMQLLRSSLCLLVMVTFLGCAAPNPTYKPGIAPPGADGDGENVYEPQARPGVETPDAAQRDLAVLLTDRKRPVGIRYLGREDEYTFANEDAALEFHSAHNLLVLERSVDTSRPRARYILIPSIPVAEEGIEVPLAPCYFDKLSDCQIRVVRSRLVTGAPQLQPYTYEVNLGNRISFLFHEQDLADAQRLADDLFLIQKSPGRQEERLATFAAQAAQYRALAVKPPMSEEQRRLVVQANTLNQQKDYDGALALYNQAIAPAPTSYPGAYYNMALLHAQQRRFLAAISSMKKYLLLAPDAPDARSAQDKIYEWEIMMKK